MEQINESKELGNVNRKQGSFEVDFEKLSVVIIIVFFPCTWHLGIEEMYKPHGLFGFCF